jgi:uncharacterized protein (DUF885 family)
MRRIRLALAAALTLGICGSAAADSARVPGDAAYERVAAGILGDFYARNPTYATTLGLHRFDGRLEDVSSAAYEDETAAIAGFHKALEAIDPQSLSLDNRLDREMLLHSLDSRRIRNEEIRSWAHNPDDYSSGITSSAFSLISRDYAPATERLKSLIAREKAMPAALMEARRNLDHPPRIYTEIAIEQLDGNQAFFRTTAVEAFADVRDPALLAEFKKSNDAVIAALGDYKTWLQKDLLPRSNGDFAWGADVYRRMLLANEMIDTPLETLLQKAEADLRRNQALFSETARKIDPAKSPSEVLASLQRDHPKPQNLLAETQAELDALARFMTENHIVTIPKDAAPAQVKETPPFMRATTSASMDTPGPFEKGNLRGFYNMTLPDPSWSAEQTEDFMRQWFYPLITNTSVHEVWPGHYLQFLYAKQYPSEARKVLGAASNAEGWAHYCEQMVIDEGFHAGEPQYRLAQLQDALLRDARFIVGIKMHTQGMTYDQAVDFFEKEGYQPRPLAVSEAKRGTSDALFGYYTMGKLAILKLREDYRKKMGPAFKLQDFHDRFIGMGPLPLPLVREAMLGERGELF